MNTGNEPVLIIDLAKYYGGADVRVIELARSLHGKRACTVAALAESPLRQRLEAEGLKVLPVPYSRSDPRLMFFIYQAIKREGFRVVDAHNPQSQFWGHLGALLAGGVRRISTVHSAYRLEHNNSMKGRFYESVLYLNRWTGNRFIAVSEAVEKYLIDTGIPAGQVRLIHNSLHLSEGDNVGKDIPLLHDLGWGEDTFIVSIVARLEPVKAHAVLVDAIAKNIERYPQLRCLIVGDGRLRDELEAQVKNLNVGKFIHFAGFRDDIPILLNASDVFCLPSLSEGLPYALLEAAGARLPVLVSKVGGMAVLLTHMENAYLIPPSDVDALAEGLAWMITHPQEAKVMGQAAFNLTQEKFSPARMIAETLAVYDSG